MAIVEAMQGVTELPQQPPQPAQPLPPGQPGPEVFAELTRQARAGAEAIRQDEAREQLREQIRTEVRTRVQNEIREGLRNGDIRPDQAGALAARIAEQAAEEAARAAALATGREIIVRRPGEMPTVVQMPNTRDMLPPQVEPITYAFFATVVILIVGLPIARAWARWLDRRGTVSAAASPEVTAQLRQLQQSVEAVAIEVERISEAQRYTARMLSEGAAQPVEVRQGERVRAS